jgi:hypothetical protein
VESTRRVGGVARESTIVVRQKKEFSMQPMR